MLRLCGLLALVLLAAAVLAIGNLHFSFVVPAKASVLVWGVAVIAFG